MKARDTVQPVRVERIDAPAPPFSVVVRPYPLTEGSVEVPRGRSTEFYIRFAVPAPAVHERRDPPTVESAVIRSRAGPKGHRLRPRVEAVSTHVVYRRPRPFGSRRLGR